MGFVIFFSVLVGFVLLVIGAEGFVRGASQLAAVAGLSRLIIGLTVVSYGTSAPELAVSLQASYAGQAEIALGNVIGSNVFNILMTLGIAAIVIPLTVAQQLIRLDVPIMIGITGLMLLFSLDGRISQLDGAIFLAGSVIYTLFLVSQGRQEDAPDSMEAGNGSSDHAQKHRVARYITTNVGLLLGSLGVLVVGAKLLVYGATSLAESMGVSQLIIGLTIVAAGTSLPELATSIVACYRGERDIAVGNVIGSNIFNILTVLGATAAIADIPVSPAAMRFDIPVMFAVAIACLPIFYTGNRISRWEGLLFVSYYVAYSTYLGLDAVGHEQLGIFSNVMLLFVIPLTVITLFALVWRRPRNKPIPSVSPTSGSPLTGLESPSEPSLEPPTLSPQNRIDALGDSEHSPK